MILVTGGMGFIGLHVARELATTDSVVLTYHRSRRSPEEVEALVGAPVAMAQVDVANPYSLAAAMSKYRPDGIVHMAVPGLGAMAPAEEIATNMAGLTNILEAGRLGDVKRVTVASSIAVYWGLEPGPFHEDRDLPVTSDNPTSAMKKAAEILALHYANRTGLDLVLLRIGMIYGPLYHSLANLPSRLLHHAVKGRPLSGLEDHWKATRPRSVFDLCYVKDCAAAVARIHRATTTRHRIYNIGSGSATQVPDILDAVAKAVPGASLPEPPPAATGAEGSKAFMDIGRLTEEFGYSPRFTLAEGIRDYAKWLEGHDL